MRPFKILSDFDGVWTDQANEADYVRRFAIDALARALGSTAADAEAQWNGFVARAKATPGEHGWAPDGRISAYVDEDPLCEGSAVCRLLDTSNDADAVRCREALARAGHATLAGFGEYCFHGGTARFRAEHPPCIVPGAKQMLRGLVDAGAEIVVVSNSVTEKLVDFFDHAGIHAVPHESAAKGELRVRGNAGKWFLGPTDASITVGGRSIHVDRPRYRAVLVDERPDLVVGDVFSLDLALPHVMRGEGRGPRVLVLRRHPHTPAWIAGDRAHGAIDAIVDQVGDIAGVIERHRD
jgi:phosphoglycolate phosphatase-like HAD superfamily hydrolase